MSGTKGLDLRTAAAPLDATVSVPSSKSLTHRALALAALADGGSLIESPLLADDTIHMAAALIALGARLEFDGPDASAWKRAVEAGAPPGPALSGGLRPGGLAGEVSLRVAGRGGRLLAPAAPLELGGSGTAVRLLTALAALAGGDVVIDGDARMRQRPIGPLLEALAALGVEARSIDGSGCPPVRVRGGTLRGGEARVAGGLSSQFVSALLMLAPLAPGPVDLEVIPPVASRPYLELTLALMREFGMTAVEGPAGHRAAAGGDSADGPLRYRFNGRGAYIPARYRVPPDASAASYFFAAAAVAGGRVTVRGLRRDSLQGDLAILGHLEAMGCRVEDAADGTTVVGPAGSAGGPVRPEAPTLRPFDLDLQATPDIVPTLAVLALFADGASVIRNAAHLRLKESDRLAALASELGRLGARIEERADGLRIEPGRLRGARIETWRDHRIAMAFAIAGLRVPGVTVADPGCVAKSFPGFWDAWSGLVPGAGSL